jgi:peptidoglycan/xylan/chitin deacetylase (PgdA/CDA1 family)
VRAPGQLAFTLCAAWLGLWTLAVSAEDLRVLSIRHGPAEVTLDLAWDTVVDQTYQLQTCALLGQGGWSDVGPVVPGTGSPATTSASVGNGQPEALFRLQIQAPSIPPPLEVPGNLLLNPSLETAASGNTNLPAQWSRDQGGKNDAIFSYLTTGHTGRRSMRVQITGYTNGAAELVPRAVPVTGGRDYTFADYYQSDTYTEIDAEITLSGGEVQYVYVGYAWPSTSWNKYSAVLTMPSNAVSLVVYHLLADVGYLATDDYALVRNPTNPPAGFDRALVSLTFDDMPSSQYDNAAPLLDARGQHGTFYGVSSWIGQPGYLSPGQVTALWTAGHEIGSHSATHAHLATVDAATLSFEVGQSQVQLQQLVQSSIVSFATPYGEYNDPVIACIRQHYESHRSTDVGFNAKDNVDPNNLVVQNVNRNVAVTTVKGWIDRAIQDRLWLILVYHDILPDGDAFSTKPADLSAELDYLQSTGVAVLTVKQALAEALPQRNQ